MSIPYSKLGAALMMSAALCSASIAFADEGTEKPWLVRVRAVNLHTADQSDAGSGALVGLPADAIHVSDKTIPEVDISYFFTKNIATELILTYPQKHDVTVSGTNIGSFKHLPPTLTLQYHFQPEKAFKPYVGAGLNYTRISNVDLASNLDLSRNSFGPAVQAGFDFEISKNVYLNVDVKKTYIRADVNLNGSKVSEVKVDPLLIGVGIGWRF
jgi:outer membrane protein